MIELVNLKFESLFEFNNEKCILPLFSSCYPSTLTFPDIYKLLILQLLDPIVNKLTYVFIFVVSIGLSTNNPFISIYSYIFILVNYTLFNL